jgi:polyhydroxybutyrate depolymerase
MFRCVGPLVLISLAACSSSETKGGTSSSSSGSGGAGGEPPVTIGDRSAEVHVPPGYSSKTPMPLVVMLHGYSVNGYIEELYLDLTRFADQYGFLYVYPDGTIDESGKGFWNATDGCCNFYGSTVDDSAYLSQLISAIEARYAVDAKRVFLIGHSNGGFMAYRMACDHADQIAGIVSLAGAMWNDPSKCKPTSPVSVLQTHGSDDMEVLLAGDPGMGTPLAGAYPAAATSVKDWALLDGCVPTPDDSAPPVDFVSSIDGPETTISRYAQGCQAGTGAELWTIHGGGHIPGIDDRWREAMLQFLLAHPKP